MFYIDYFGIENPSNYAHSKAALDIILDEISKSEFAGRVIWGHRPDSRFESNREESDPNWAQSHGAEFGGPFYGKIFYLLGANGEVEESFPIFMDDLEGIYTKNEAWYNLVKAALDRIDPLQIQAYGSSIYLEDDEDEDPEEDLI